MIYVNKTYEAAAVAQSVRCVVTEKTGIAGWVAFINHPNQWLMRIERQRLAKAIKAFRNSLPGRVTPFGQHCNPYDA